MDNKTKSIIIDRLHESSSVCSICSQSSCIHGGGRNLPYKLDVDKVLRAINIDEYFFKEKVVDEMRTMVSVFNGVIKTRIFPEVGSPCHKKIIELLGDEEE